MTQDSPKIQAIKERYKTSFPEKKRLIEQFKQVVEQNEDLNVVHEGLHKLAGSSGMYGYDDIATLCRAAMLNLAQRQLNKVPSQLDELVALLDNHL